MTRRAAVRIAQFSLFSPAFVMITTAVLGQPGGDLSTPYERGQALGAAFARAFVCIVGAVLALIALRATREHREAVIRVSAWIGLVFNVIFIVTSIATASKMKVQATDFHADVLMPASNARAETIEDTQFGFTLVVPQGYIHLPANGDNVHIFSTSDPADGWPDALVTLQRMHGKIGRGHVPLSSDAPARSRQFFVKWKTYDVEVLTSTSPWQG